MTEITFYYNWNGKLNCKAFTTLRLKNDRKYCVGGEYQIVLQEKPGVQNAQMKGIHTCLAIKNLKINQINEFIARLDTGLSAEKCIELIKTMYKNKGIDWEIQDLSLILLTK